MIKVLKGVLVATTILASSFVSASLISLPTTVDTYVGQDSTGSASVSAGLDVLSLSGNTWKTISGTYDITSSTVLTFDFKSDLIGEVHGIGFDTNGNFDYFTSTAERNGLKFFQLAGTQTFGNQMFNNYGAADVGNWVTYTIDLGTYFTGSFSNVFFANDADVTPFAAEGMFRFPTTTANPVNAPSVILLALVGMFLLVKRKVA